MVSLSSLVVVSCQLTFVSSRHESPTERVRRALWVVTLDADCMFGFCRAMRSMSVILIIGGEGRLRIGDGIEVVKKVESGG